ncbi:MAG: hypothetical protein A4E72_01817 [Syntrophus sp. PtaU1.Bin208]|nr:MAG: hypothetical protein A4E72_01817 [Syntrophus sp. PtaU1.Bin208]
MILAFGLFDNLFINPNIILYHMVCTEPFFNPLSALETIKPSHFSSRPSHLIRISNKTTRNTIFYNFLHISPAQGYHRHSTGNSMQPGNLEGGFAAAWLHEGIWAS